MKTIEINVDTTPKPQARARVTRFGTYDPTSDYKSWIKYQIVTHFEEMAQKPLDCPLRVEAEFRMPIPKSISKKKRQAIYEDPRHYKRPDAKNLYAAIEDAMNEIAYKDDCLIWNFEVFKVYSDNPGITIKITY